MIFEMSDREVEVIRMALRSQQDAHQRNGFAVLMHEVQELRSRLSDAYIDKNLSVR